MRPVNINPGINTFQFSPENS